MLTFSDHFHLLARPILWEIPTPSQNSLVAQGKPYTLLHDKTNKFSRYINLLFYAPFDVFLHILLSLGQSQNLLF